MKVLIACEYSGRTREAFRRLGHDAMSADFEPAEDRSTHHYQGDCFDLINSQHFDLMIAHPPCTYLTNSAEWAFKDAQTKKMRPGTLIGAERRAAREEAIAFVLRLANAPIKRIAIENPIGVLSARWRKPDQFIQPYDFGDDASKRTCLWIKNLPPLRPTKYVDPRWVCCGETLPDGVGKYGCPNCCGANVAKPRWGESDQQWAEQGATCRGSLEDSQRDVSGLVGCLCRSVGKSGMNLGDIATTLVDVKGKALKPASVKQIVANKAPPRERNYTISPFRAIKDQRINKSAAMIVLLAICSYTNRHGETWVSQQTIADLLEVSRQAVGKQMRRLIELGYLEVVSPSSAHTTARYRVVFDPTKTLEDVKATIPAALQPEQPAPKPVSKEAARERLKEVKRTIQTQPQKLPLEPNQTQPLEVAPKGNSDATKTGLDATSEVATPATTGSCMKGSFKVIKEGIQEVWKKEGFEVASADMRAHERACEVIDAWQIPTELLGDLLHSTKTTCLSRALPLPTSADHFARLGEESVWDLIARLPAKRATA